MLRNYTFSFFYLFQTFVSVDSIYNISQGNLLSAFIKIASIGNQSFILVKISDLILREKLLIIKFP